MPNHVTNKLTLSGDGHLVAACLESLKSETSPLDFNRIVKAPDVFHEIAIGHCTIDGESVTRWREIPNPAYGTGARGSLPMIPVAVPAEELVELLMRYGHDNWRDWAYANWGTKWNCYDVAEWHVAPDQDESGRAEIQFDTAWSTPTEAMMGISKEWSALTIDVEYADEDIGNNCGSYTVVAGEVVSRTELAGETATKFACELKGMGYLEYLQELED